MFTIQGKIHEVFNTQEISDRFQKREFILETEDKYPQFVKFQVINDKVVLMDGFSKGDPVEVTFRLNGKPFQNRNGETIYFTNLNVVKLLSLKGGGDNQDNSGQYDPNQDIPENPYEDDNAPPF